jgi:hypothetical protein
LGNRWFWHGELSSKGDKAIIVEIGERPHNSKENRSNHGFLLRTPMAEMR